LKKKKREAEELSHVVPRKSGLLPLKKKDLQKRKEKAARPPAQRREKRTLAILSEEEGWR